MQYPIAEKFFAPQGEGLYAGTPMAFVRLVGCSVGKGICTACDTDFEQINERMGGGKYEPYEILEWSRPYRHLCITGGEPLDRDLEPLYQVLPVSHTLHIETSGTKVLPNWIVGSRIWVTVSPKPGYRPATLKYASEIKVILGGLGDGPGWPTLQDALRWAREGHLVYVQPRNFKYLPDDHEMAEALKVVTEYPELRLSTQLHKYLHTR